LTDPQEKEWVVYLLRCSDDSLYCGITNNLLARLKKHNSGKGSKYVAQRLPAIILKYFPVQNRSMASKIELKVKKLSREEKLRLNSINQLIS
jgi:putative endonuclease